MNKKKIAIIVSLSIGIIATCIIGKLIYNDYNDPFKKLFDEQDNITLINDTKSIKDETIISKIETYENVIGYDWLNDKEIFVTQANKDVPLIKNELGIFDVMNLGLYNLESKSNRVIGNKEKSQKYSIVSPDKKHIFYMEYVSEFEIGSKGYIADKDGNIKAKINANNMSVSDFAEAKWINNDEVIMPYHKINGFCILNIKGNSINIKNVEDVKKRKEDGLNGKQIINPIKLNNKIYYNINYPNGKDDKKMKVYDINTEVSKDFIEDKIVNFEVSPNKKQIFITRMKDNSCTELVITDLAGKVEDIIGIKIGIPYGECWAPDNSKVSYITSEGVNIFDLKTKKNYLILSGEYYIPTKWSPSSKKIMVHGVKEENGKFLDNTMVITLK